MALLLLLLLLLLVAAAPPSRALTVGYFSDSNCTHLAATRTTWTGFCQAGLAVADCWDLPAGSYSNGLVYPNREGHICPLRARAHYTFPLALLTAYPRRAATL